jgi:hypothetical protein
MIREELEELLRSTQANWTEADRLLAARVIADRVKLTASLAMGQDVSRELAHVDAQIANIIGTEQLSAAAAINRVFEAVIGKAVQALLL